MDVLLYSFYENEIFLVIVDYFEKLVIFGLYK